MMSLLLKGTMFIFGYNNSVLCNMSVPDSMLKNRFQSISYYLVFGGAARDECSMLYVDTHNN